MRHIDPGMLALVALGEAGASRDDEAHLARCPRCAQHLHNESRVVTLGRAAAGAGALLSPRPEVWFAIRAELHLSQSLIPPDTELRR